MTRPRDLCFFDLIREITKTHRFNRVFNIHFVHVCALSFMAVPPKGEGSSDEGGKCPITVFFSRKEESC